MYARFFIASSVSSRFLKFNYHSSVCIGASRRISVYRSFFTNHSYLNTKFEMGNEGNLYIGSYLQGYKKHKGMRSSPALILTYLSLDLNSLDLCGSQVAVSTSSDTPLK